MSEINMKTIIGRILFEEAVHQVVDLVKTYMGSSIDIGEFNWDSYQQINRLVYKLNPEKFSQYRSPTTNKQLFELESGVRYSIRIPRHNVWILVSSYKTESKIYMGEKRIKLTFHGKEKQICRNRFIQKLLQCSDQKTVNIEYMSDGEKIKSKLIPMKLDNIIMKSSDKNYLLSGINSWKSSKEWYNKHGLVHKIGILLYGKPGAGKSTLIRAISGLVGGAPVLTVSPKNIIASISSIVRKRDRISGTIIVLMEDFDMFLSSRTVGIDENDSNNEQMQKDQENQNALFQLLDGVYSTDNTIYIATTNHIKKLDPALIRYGRFDIQLELPYFDKKMCKEFIKAFNYPDEITHDMNISSYPVCPSYLQSEIMRIRSTEGGVIKK